MIDRRHFLIGAGALLTASFVRRASAISKKTGRPLIVPAAQEPEETLYVYWQSSWLRAPDRPEQGGDKIDLLPFYESNQISDDGARLNRFVRRVGADRAAVRASQLESILQMFGVGGVKRLARNVTVSGCILFRVEIAQPHVDT